MSEPRYPRPVRDPVGLPSFGLVTALLLVVAFESSAVSPTAAMSMVLVALGVAAVLRAWGGRAGATYALVPVFAAVAFGSVVVPVTVLNEVLLGFAAVAALLWLADGPDRTPGSLRRATDFLLLPAVAFGIALAGSLLLPAGELRLGVASLLLVGALLLIGIVLTRPDALRRA